jgi:hypothetical protein
VIDCKIFRVSFQFILLYKILLACKSLFAVWRASSGFAAVGLLVLIRLCLGSKSKQWPRLPVLTADHECRLLVFAVIFWNLIYSIFMICDF